MLTYYETELFFTCSGHWLLSFFLVCEFNILQKDLFEINYYFYFYLLHFKKSEKKKRKEKLSEKYLIQKVNLMLKKSWSVPEMLTSLFTGKIYFGDLPFTPFCLSLWPSWMLMCLCTVLHLIKKETQKGYFSIHMDTVHQQTF